MLKLKQDFDRIYYYVKIMHPYINKINPAFESFRNRKCFKTYSV